MTPPAPDRGDLLLRVAAEVEQCRKLVQQVETTLAPLIQARMVGGTAPQAIDRLDQILADLALCVAGLGHGLPDDAVLAPLRLDDLRRRLKGQETPAAEASVALF